MSGTCVHKWAFIALTSLICDVHAHILCLLVHLSSDLSLVCLPKLCCKCTCLQPPLWPCFLMDLEHTLQVDCLQPCLLHRPCSHVIALPSVLSPALSLAAYVVTLGFHLNPTQGTTLSLLLPETKSEIPCAFYILCLCQIWSHNFSQELYFLWVTFFELLWRFIRIQISFLMQSLFLPFPFFSSSVLLVSQPTLDLICFQTVLVSPKTHTPVSYHHRIIDVGRGHWRCLVRPSLFLSLAQSCFEYLQQWRLHNLSGHPGRFEQPDSKKKKPKPKFWGLNWMCRILNYAHSILPFSWNHWEEFGSTFFSLSHQVLIHITKIALAFAS